jgi:hypothetical protein
MLRAIGAGLLVLAWRTALYLVHIGQGLASHEPPLAYLLSLAAFCCASAGAALLCHGHHLFDRIAISERWTSRAPTTMQQPDWLTELDESRMIEGETRSDGWRSGSRPTPPDPHVR